MEETTINSRMLHSLLHGGSDNLRRHMEEVNDLNVFPIPDGDTGSNMLLTVQGGERIPLDDHESVGSASRRVADAMLLSARGNSGVILSQFADGIADGLRNCGEEAHVRELAEAFSQGVEHAYAAVLEPTEGTILTVVREATEYASEWADGDLNQFLSAFLHKAHETLAATPEMLPVLKKAGVVDSGGAGLIYIVEGMSAVLNGGEFPEAAPLPPQRTETLNLDLFTEDSVLQYGYCTELLLRLQRSKTDVESFDVSLIRSYLQTVGDSIVCFRTGSIVKIHVHTTEPEKVLAFCHQYGEFLTLKIENMSLQHNNLPADSPLAEQRDKARFAVVAVASGEGLKQVFRELGADYVIDGGPLMNPSADDFVEAFRRVRAETIFILPNNGNAILAARQAAGLYPQADVRVIETKNVGEGHAALSMLNPELAEADAVEREMTESMTGVITAGVSCCSRDAIVDDYALHTGQYIGCAGKKIVSADNDRRDTACMLADRLDFAGHEICILFRGLDSEAEEAEEIAAHIRCAHPGCEVFVLDGGQEIYSYLLVVE